MDGLIVDGLISLSHSHSHSLSLTHRHNHSFSLSHNHSHTHSSMKEAALCAASTQGGGTSRRPPGVNSFMDGCVADAVAVAEINPSTINPPAIWDRFGFLFSKNIVCSKNIAENRILSKRLSDGLH